MAAPAKSGTSITSIAGSVGKAAAQGMYIPTQGNPFMDQPDMVRSRGNWKISPLDVEAFKAISQAVQPKEAVPAEVCNKKFNRHLDVLPDPRTRVEVPITLNDEGVEDISTAYYNANYIHGPDKNYRAYICAMGPLPATLKTWWRMMWHNRVGVIIMATGLVEKKEKKCERYWAPKPGQKVKVADMIVKTTGVTENPAYTTTYLEVQHSETNETRKMVHYWFTAWPDHGVPRLEDGTPDPSSILYMLRDARRWERQNNIKTPMMIHCSAGVGRSGTILAIDYACQLLEANKAANVAAVVAEIRKDRVALVQHPQQYELCQVACELYAKLLEVPMKVDKEATTAPLFMLKPIEIAEYQYVDPSTIKVPGAPQPPPPEQEEQSEYKAFKAVDKGPAPAAVPARTASRPPAAAPPPTTLAESPYGAMAAVLAAKARRESQQNTAAANVESPYGAMAAVLATKGVSPYGASGPAPANGYGDTLTSPNMNYGQTGAPKSNYGAMTKPNTGNVYGSSEDAGATSNQVYGAVVKPKAAEEDAYGSITNARANLKKTPTPTPAVTKVAPAELEYGDTGPVPRAQMQEMYEDVQDESGVPKTLPPPAGSEEFYGNQAAVDRANSSAPEPMQQEMYGNQEAIETNKTATEAVVDSWAAPKKKPSKKDDKEKADKAKKEAEEDRKRQEVVAAAAKAAKEEASKRAALEEQLRKAKLEREERARIVAKLLEQEEKAMNEADAELKALVMHTNDLKLAVTRAEMVFKTKEEEHRALVQKAEAAERDAQEGPSLIKRNYMDKRNDMLAKLVDVELAKGNAQEKLLTQYLSKAPPNKIVNNERLLGKKRYITDRVATSEARASVCEDTQFFALLAVVVKKAK